MGPHWGGGYKKDGTWLEYAKNFADFMNGCACCEEMRNYMPPVLDCVFDKMLCATAFYRKRSGTQLLQLLAKHKTEDFARQALCEAGEPPKLRPPEPHPRDRGHRLLRSDGRPGELPLIVSCEKFLTCLRCPPASCWRTGECDAWNEARHRSDPSSSGESIAAGYAVFRTIV